MATPVGLIPLLPGEEEPFYVEVDPSALISALKSKVQEARKHTALSGVRPDDLNLWKLEPPMRTADLCARLSEMDISEFGVEMPSEDPVLNWFPTQPTSCVHFVVELAYADFKASKSLWRRFWNKPMENEIVSKPVIPLDGEDDGPQLPSFEMIEFEDRDLPRSNRHLFIRPEYRIALQGLQKIRAGADKFNEGDVWGVCEKSFIPLKPVQGVVLTGQSGDGKSTSLWYILIARLSAGQPTWFQYQSFFIYHFDKNGVRVHDARSPFIMSCPHEWALVDSNYEVSKPHPSFQSQSTFVVWATSQNEEKYRGWRKDLVEAPFYTVDNWTWAEVLNVAVHAWGLDVDDPKIQLMRTVFIKYGPTVQICRNVLLDFVRIFVGSLLGEILSIRTSGEIFDNLLGAPKNSRDWCLVIPGKDRYPEGRVITDHVEELLVTHLLDLDPSEGYAIYSTPETYPAFSSLKDRILERVVHSILPRSHHAIFPMPRVGEAEHLLDLTGVSYRPIQNLESLSRNFRRGVYWVPETRRGVTAVHSVAIVKDTLYIFRITRRSKQTIQFPLLKSIRDALPQKLQSVDKWKFVWVVPYHKSKAFSNPKTVDESGGNTWHQNLQQFVMPVDICSDLLRRAHVARLETWPVEKLRLDDSDCR